MQILCSASLKSRKPADLLVIPCWRKKDGAELATFAKELNTHVAEALAAGDFKGDLEETLFLYPKGQKEKRFVLLGLGKPDAISADGIRKAYSAAAKVGQKRKVKSLNVILPEIAEIFREELVRASAEGLYLGNYSFSALKHDALKESSPSLIEKAYFIGLDTEDEKTLKKAQKLISAVHFVRDLVNGNADDVTPQVLAKTAKDLAKEFSSVKTEVFDKKRIEKEKMGLLLAVSRGSHLDPAFIIISYHGDPHSKERTVLVGKGITYDTGGLNLKTTGMETQKGDMAGAGAVLGCLRAAASIKLKKNVIGVIPTAENAIGPASYKPGDVYQGYSGKTVEITNTDAEGRLVLADALAYTVKNLHPTRIIDLGTLTGGVIVALSEEIAGLFSNNQEMISILEKASKITGEMIWHLPLHLDYKKLLKSEVADIKNSGIRHAHSMQGAIFLHEFVGTTPWAHLDIAGTAFMSKPSGYNPMYATGSGVRLIIEFLEQMQSK